MSTRSSIAYHDDGVHLYHECMDDGDAIWLELEGIEGLEYEVSKNAVLLRIPMWAWEFVRTHTNADWSMEHATDAEIAKKSAEFVDKRIEDCKVHGGAMGIFGLWNYGPADKPRDEQVATGIAYLTERRAVQQERRRKIMATTT